MKINSTIIKGIYRVCLKHHLLEKDSSVFLQATEQLSQLEANHQIESLILLDPFTDLLTDIIEAHHAKEWGWFIGAHLKTQDLGILGHYLYSCKHLFFAHQKLNKYQLLVSDLVNFTFELKGSVVVWNLTTPFAQNIIDNELLQIVNDLEISYRHNIVSTLLQKTFNPATLHVTYPYDEKHHEFLQKKYHCPIQYDKEVSSIYYKVADVNCFIPSQNYYFYYQGESILIDLLQKWYQDSNNYSLITKRFILSNIGHFQFSIQAAAERFNISTRHLQRQLEQEETNYNQILEECRKELSLLYIKKGLINKEIAHRLGYSETNSFIRAFKKWFGQSIRDFKKRT